MLNKKIILFALPVLLMFGTAVRAQNVIPHPNNMVKNGQAFHLTRLTHINGGEFRDLADYLNTHIWRAGDYLLTISPVERNENSIVMLREESLPKEGYTIEVTDERITLAASGHAGMFYAVQTLLQLMPPSVYGGRGEKIPVMVIPGVKISDAPRFGYRGAHLDISRTFSDKQTVMKYIDWMSRHKLNKFHWHLTDDNGWRIEIKAYPELTEKGAWRGPGEVLPPMYGSGERRYGGYFTQEDIREVVAFAQLRNVEIIPEIDLPGHSKVITHVYQETLCPVKLANPGVMGWERNVLCVGREENYEMLTVIFAEIAGLFPSRYIHIGGDEVSMAHWQSCPNCKELMRKQSMKSTQELLNYFVRRMEAIVKSLGKESMAWNEVLDGGPLEPTTVISGWENVKACEKAVQKGQPVVLMPASYFYIDMRQGPTEKGHSWAGMVDTRTIYSFNPDMVKATPEQKKLILGIEGALWAELLQEPDGFLEYQAYPKLCAVAEVGWTDQNLRSYDDFYRRLTQSHLERLGRMGIRYRMFAPEISYNGAAIEIKNVNPQAETYYRTKAGEGEFRFYDGMLPVSDPWDYEFETRYFGGKSSLTRMHTSYGISLKPAEKRTVTLPLAKYAPKDGIWIMNFQPVETGVMINRMEVSGGSNPYIIIGAGQAVNPLSLMRLYVKDDNSAGNLVLTLTNTSGKNNDISLTFTKSQYIEPKVTARTSMEINTRFPLGNITDYNQTTYARSTKPCVEGDYILYTFAEPVTCSSMEIRTGIPGQPRYIVTKGEVMASQDGIAFKSYGMVDNNGCLVFKPTGPVKSVRLNIKDVSGEPIVAFQDILVK